MTLVQNFLGREAIRKERLSKAYRHKQLDEKLTTQRIKEESRCIAKCIKASIRCPSLYFVDLSTSSIYMEYIKGPTLKQYIFDNHQNGFLSSSITHTYTKFKTKNEKRKTKNEKRKTKKKKRAENEKN